MSFVVNLTKHIASKIHSTLKIGSIFLFDDLKVDVAGHTSSYMPNFLWVLRDFVLDLEDEHGNPITASEYLEQSLQEKYAQPLMLFLLLDLTIARPGHSAKNDIRRALKEFFVRRDCATLVRPTHGTSPTYFTLWAYSIL